MGNVNAKFWPKVNPKYMEFFPKGEPDQDWNSYESQQEDIIKQKIADDDLNTQLEGFIQLIHLCLEYNARPHNPHNRNPKQIWLLNDLLKLSKSHIDFKYYNVLMRMSFLEEAEKCLFFLLHALTSLKERNYTPLDSLMKLRIRSLFKDFNFRRFKSLDNYKEYFNEYD